MTINVLILGDGIGGIVTANLLLKKARKRSLDLRIRLVGHSGNSEDRPPPCKKPRHSPKSIPPSR